MNLSIIDGRSLLIVALIAGVWIWYWFGDHDER